MYPGAAYSPPTELSSSITAVSQAIPVKDISVFPEAPNTAVLEHGGQWETIGYGGISGNSLTQITRAIAKGDTARDWPAGTQIARWFTSDDLNDLQENVRRSDENIKQIQEEIETRVDDMLSGTAIQPAADLNTLTTPGLYHATSEVSPTLQNAPVGNAFFLQVWVNEDGQVAQKLFDTVTQTTIARYGDPDDVHR